MVALSRWLVVVLLLVPAVTRVQAAAPAAEARAFTAAAEAFQGGFYQRAETEFAQFASAYPGSVRLAEATLLQAEARIQLTNYAGAIDLLSAHRANAGVLADQYLFWLAEAFLRKGDYGVAAENFAAVAAQHPGSARLLEAVIGEANARAKMSDWERTAVLLSQTNGVFQTFARTNAPNEWVLRGFLLLAEAQLARKDFAAAEAALDGVQAAQLNPQLAWQRLFLLCRIEVAAGRPQQALENCGPLRTAATNAASAALQAETVAFHAGLLDQVGRVDDAIRAYQENLAEGVPAERQRQALLKSTELYLRRNRGPEAAQTLQQFLTRYPDSPATDLALLTLGELRLGQEITGADADLVAFPATNAPAGSNGVSLAEASLKELVTRFPQSPLTGKAQLNLGWCYLWEGRLADSQAAYRTAIGLLPPSLDQATAYFKLADVQLQQKDFTNALANYSVVVDKFPNVPEVKANLYERALYQAIRAAVALGETAAATNKLAVLLAGFPNGPWTDRGLLVAGTEISRRGEPARARDMFSSFLASTPQSPLSAQIQLAIARTYEEQNNWTNAIQQYDAWLNVHTNSEAHFAAEYYRAYANAQAGLETNALTLFTNFVAHYPTNEYAPRAQWWVADYYFRSGEFQRSELNYQMLFRNTNSPSSDLAYEAQMMAGRAAFAREIWTDASNYFTTIWNNTNCPTPLRVQALFAYGDVLMSMDAPETNRVANYDEAIRVFSQICESYPKTREAALAWGEKASCLLQWAQVSRQYDDAANAFRQVITNQVADARARSIATVGLAVVREKQAQEKKGGEQTALLREALNHCLDVFYGKVLRDGEQPDLFWMKESGLRAARLAETLQEWQQAIGVYQQLTRLLPPLRPRLEKSLLRAQEQLDRGKG